MGNHSAGPWLVTETDAAYHILSPNKRGQYVAEIKKLKNFEEQKGNAALIAAAPDLLCALVAVFCECSIHGCHENCFMIRVEKALAKARGEA